MALQYLLRVVVQMTNVIAARVGRSVVETSDCAYASRSTLIYWKDDLGPDFRFYETKYTALDILKITNCQQARIIQCLMTAEGGTAEDMLQDPGG